MSFAGQTREATASDSGRWQVTLDTSDCGDGPFELLVQLPEGTAVIRSRDVLMGEVWLCSGQSNMEFRLVKEAGAEREIPAAAYPRLRQCRVRNAMSPGAL